MITEIVVVVLFLILGYILPRIDKPISTSPRFVSNKFMLFILFMITVLFFAFKTTTYPIPLYGLAILVSLCIGAFVSMYKLGDFKKERIITDSL